MAKNGEMMNWNYAKAWKFFTANAFGRMIPETELYLRSLTSCLAEDIRGILKRAKKSLAL